MHTSPIQKYWRMVAIASLAGMIVTAYLIYQHYKPAGDSFCTVNDFVSCDVVNKSVYSEIFGIPVSILGFATYAFFFALSLAVIKKADRINVQALTRIAAIVGLLGLAFSFYLTVVEFFVLFAVCILCITQQLLILFISIILTIVWRKNSLRAHLSS